MFISGGLNPPPNKNDRQAEHMALARAEYRMAGHRYLPYHADSHRPPAGAWHAVDS